MSKYEFSKIKIRSVKVSESYGIFVSWRVDNPINCIKNQSWAVNCKVQKCTIVSWKKFWFSDDKIQAKTLVLLCKHYKWTRVGTIFTTDDYSSELAKEFSQEATNQGIAVDLSISFQFGQKDVQSQMGFDSKKRL